MRSLAYVMILAVALAVGQGVFRAAAIQPAFSFEVEIATTRAGRVQLYFDRGHGLSETDSVAQSLVAGGPPQRVSLPLAAGTYRLFRFDPIDHDAEVVVTEPRIVGPAGFSQPLPLERFAPNDQIEQVSPATGAHRIVPRRGVNDPYLTAALTPPLTLELSGAQRLLAQGRHTAYTAVIIALGFGVVAWAWARRTTLAAKATAHPNLTLVLVAIGAAVAASYPVVLAGRSFVSPNTTPLLKQTYPTVAGYTDTTRTNLHAADPAVMMWQNVPYGAIQHEALLREGSLPLWNRYASAGVTLIGQGQSMLGDPLHALVILSRSASWAWDVKFVLAKGVFALGLALLVWRMTADLTAAIGTAIAAAFAGFFNFRFNHPAVFSFAYSPWILVGWAGWAGWAQPLRATALSAWTGRRSAIATLVLANLAVLASGTVKEAYALLLVLNAVGCVAWLWRGNRAALRDFAALAAVTAAFAALTAPLWLSFALALRRSATAYAVPHVWQAPRDYLIGLFDPLFHVEMSLERLGYLPGANLVFAVGGLFAIARIREAFGPASAERRAVARFICVAGLACLGCAALAFGFVPADAIAAVPLLRSVYHVHNTFSVVAVVLLGAIGGIGLHALRARLRQPRAWRTLAAGAIAAALLLTSYFSHHPAWWAAAPEHVAAGLVPADHRFFFVQLFLAAVGAAALVWAATTAAARWTAVRAAVVVLAFLALLYRHGLHVPLGFGGTHLTFPMVRAPLDLPSPALEAAKRAAAGEPFRLVGTDLNLVNSWNAIYRVESVNGPDALKNPQYREFMETAGLVPREDWRAVITADTLARQRPVLDALGVRYVVTDAPSLPDAAGYEPVGAFDLQLHRSPSAWPRAFYVPALQRYESPADLIARLGGEPFAAIQEGDDEAKAAAEHPPAGADAPAWVAARHYELGANHTRFKVTAPAAGYAVLHETWLPGDFRARVNETPVEYFRVNHAFKAVRLPASGDYEIEFAYWPRGFTLAIWMSLAGALALGAMAWHAGRTETRRILPGRPAD